MTTEQSDVLVKGGILVSGSGMSRSDVLISQGVVSEIGPDLSARRARRTIDAAGKYVLPGGIDSHAHPVSGDKMDTYSMCAAYGGVTTVAAFIGSDKHRHERFGNAWGIRDYNPDIVKGFIEFGERTSYTDFAVHGYITPRDIDTIDKVIPELIRMGAISFKMFLTWNPWVRDAEVNLTSLPDDMVMRVMDLAARDGGMAMVHAENGCCKAYLENKYRAQGRTSRRDYLDSAPNIIEAEAVNRAATMALITGSPLYPVHLSTHEVMPVVEHYKDRGLPLYAETCPHYLTLTNDDLLERGYSLKVSPPLRREDDKEALWRSLASGTLNTIGSDFTGQTRALKLTGSLQGEYDEPEPDQEDIFNMAPGLSTLEFMMPVVWAHGVNTGRITLPRFVQIFCENPATIFGMYPKKGSLQPGSDADLVIWDHTLAKVVDQDHANSDLDTFKGKELLGLPVLTMVGGEVVIEGENLTGRQGRAKYVPGNPNSTPYAPHGPDAT